MADPIMSGNIPISYQSSPVAYNGGWFDAADGSGAFRGLSGLGINSAAIAKEDWLRTEQSADNALYRDMIAMQYANKFNAEEAQKQRDFEERLANTSYQRAVADMKKAGINPIMLMGNGGADVPQGSSASSFSRSSSGSTYRGSSSDAGGVLRGLMSVVAGLLTKGKSTMLTQTFNQHGELTGSTVRTKNYK